MCDRMVDGSVASFAVIIRYQRQILRDFQETLIWTALKI